MKTYYEAYDDRYKAVHRLGLSWSSDCPTPIVLETIEKYRFAASVKMLEIGCGEGRDAFAVLDRGFDLTATDVSPEAIRFCRERSPGFSDRFRLLDCTKDTLDARYDFIFSVAVVHMLVEDCHRQRFYGFIRDHFAEGGLALICSMGDGTAESSSDVAAAFKPVRREHPSGAVTVPQTSCRIVSLATFDNEIRSSGLYPVEIGLAASPPEFDKMLYAVVRASVF